MSSKATIQVGNTVIRARAKLVKSISAPRVQKTIRNLIDSMRHHNLVGMAAPQLGESIRVFVGEVRKTSYRKNIKELDPLKVFTASPGSGLASNFTKTVGANLSSSEIYRQQVFVCSKDKEKADQFGLPSVLLLNAVLFPVSR